MSKSFNILKWVVRVFAAAMLIALIWLGFSGCQSGITRLITNSKPKTPEVLVEPKRVSVTGDAKTAPTVDTKETDVVMPIPEGSRIERDEKSGITSITLAKATQMAVNRTETAIKGPVAFDPPKAPTVQEVAKAESDTKTRGWLWIGMIGGGALAAFGMVRAWDLVMYGGGSVAAACAVGVFMVNHPIIAFVVVAGVVVAIVGPAIYHLKIKPLEKKSVATETDSQ